MTQQPPKAQEPMTTFQKPAISFPLLKPIFRALPRPAPSVLQLGMAWFAERPGGMDRYFADLLRNLRGDGIDVRGLVTGSPTVEVETAGIVRAVEDRYASLPKRWSAMRAAVRRELAGPNPPNLLTSHFAMCAFPVLDQLRNVPFVVHFHGPWGAEGRQEGSPLWRTAIKYLVERQVYRRADRCIVLSNAFGKILSDSFGVDKSRIRVVPGGVDLSRFADDACRDQARRQLGLPPDRPIIVCVRRLLRRMGLENLIDATRAVRRTSPNVLVLIAGAGPLEQELRDRIEATGQTQSIQLMGFVPEDRLPMLYRAADLSVVPSISLEGFGLSTIESLASGTPVLVTPIGGLPEAVGELSPELIFRDSSPVAIAAGLTDALLGAKPLPTSAQCQAFAAERYDWRRVARDVFRVYEEVAAPASGAGAPVTAVAQ